MEALAPNALTWPQVGTLIAFLMLLLGVIRWVSGAIADTKKDVGAQINEVKDTLNDFRVEVARTYATNKSLGDTEASLHAALSPLYTRIDNISDRLDKLFVALVPGKS